MAASKVARIYEQQDDESGSALQSSMKRAKTDDNHFSSQLAEPTQTQPELPASAANPSTPPRSTASASSPPPVAATADDEEQPAE